MPKRSACLITTGPLSARPRMFKCATALVDAGYEVRLVTCPGRGAWSEFDESLAKRRDWSWDRFPVSTPDRIRRRLGRAAMEPMIRAGGWRSPVFATRAAYPASAALARFAAREPADIFMGFGANSLPVAVRAAAAQRSLAGFDAEDFHPGEFLDGTHSASGRARLTLDRHYLPRCRLLTAGSPGIARAYRESCGVEMTSVLNVFPLEEAPTEPRPLRTRDKGPLRAYWFSQVVGLDRGLQQFIEAMGVARTPVEFEMRGSLTAVVRDALMAVAERAGVARQVRFLPLAPPAELVALSRDYDFGLSTEISVTGNDEVSLGNKLFAYLLAGVPVLLSSTRANREFAPFLGLAARVVEIGDPGSVAACVDSWASNASTLEEARAQAWRLGRERYNWDVEKSVFLAAIDDAMRSAR